MEPQGIEKKRTRCRFCSETVLEFSIYCGRHDELERQADERETFKHFV